MKENKETKLSNWDYVWMTGLFAFASIGFVFSVISITSYFEKRSLERIETKEMNEYLQKEVIKIERVLTDCQKAAIGGWSKMTKNGIAPLTCEK